MVKTYVLDASAFIYGTIPDGEILTPSRVYDEVKDDRSRLKLELLTGLVVRDPASASVDSINETSKMTGDSIKLSLSDIDLLALALEEKNAGKDVSILTDDYAVQNVARKIGINIIPLHQKRIKYKIVWEKRCIGCNRAYEEGETCTVCGSPLRLKKKQRGS